MNETEMVDRCVCLGRTFAEMMREGSLEEAMAEGAGRECEGCLPWLKLAFATGETRLAIDDPRLEP
ncbi:MAG: hypothetical protein R8K47_08645 [Mariprofundaceae bacterium]